MPYTKTVWENYPSTATPLNAVNLNKIENAMAAIYTMVEDGDFGGAVSSVGDGVTQLVGEVDLSNLFAELVHSHAASEITSGLLSLSRAPAGSTITYDYVKGGFGASPGSLPATRPLGARDDATMIYKCPVDPVAVVRLGDEWKVTA